MTQTPVPDDLAATAARLERLAGEWREEAQALRADLGRQRQFGRTNRRAIWGLVISIAADVALSIVVAILAVQTANNNSASQRNHDSQVAACVSGNQQRSDNHDLWNFILQLSVLDPSKVPQDTQRALQRLKDKLDVTYAQRDCDRLGPDGAPTVTPPSKAPSKTPTSTHS